MHSTVMLATTQTPKMDGQQKVLSVNYFNPVKEENALTKFVKTLLLMETGSTHSPFYAQNMMYMRAYDPSGFQRTSPYGMGKVLNLIYCLNWASLIDFFSFFFLFSS